jgi:hypothetical protein
MSYGWIAGVMLATIGIAGLVAVPNGAFAANNTKPREIVVVGSKIKKKSGDTLIHRWQRSRPRSKGLKTK